MKLKFLTLGLSLFFSVVAYAQLKVRPDGGIQMAYNGYNSFYIDSYPLNGSDNGQWSFEHWDSGFNLWKPAPSPNAGNYFIFVRDDNGNVGIGKKPTGTYKLDVNGSIWCTFITQGSDARLKTNIQPLSNCLNTLTKLNGKSYFKALPPQAFNLGSAKDSIKYNTIRADMKKAGKTLGNAEFGLIAQEVKAIYPQLVTEDSAGYMGINYIGLIPVIIEALKDEKALIDAQNTKIKELEGRISKLETKLSGGLRLGSTTGTTSTTEATTPLNAFLYENKPNPFNVSTEIAYFLPDNISSAFLYIFDMQGIIIKKIGITNKGQGSVTINASDLKPGMYIYSLIVDGTEVDTKRMILTQ